jgi:hypothetical protein
MGTSVAGHASANTKSSWQQLLSATSDAAYGIHVALFLPNSANSNRSALADIGIDPAGGSSYSVAIPNLLFHAAASAGMIGAHQFFFPLFIPAGASIAARFQCGTGGLTAEVRAQLLCRPDRPELWRCGSVVRAFGVNEGTSGGTLLTEGTTSEGSWAQIGANTAEPLWFWQLGFGYPTNSIVAQFVDFDLGLGDGSATDVVINNERIYGQISESIYRGSHQTAVCAAPSNTGVYARAQAEGAVSPYCAAYGMG